jgi:hypothetical protein
MSWSALRCVGTVVLVSAAFAAANAQPDPHLAKLDYHALMGSWTCRGSDDRGALLAASMEWAFNDGGAFYLNVVPKPATPTHALIAETWEWDAVAGVWRAIPDAGSADLVQFTSRGWSGPTLTWVRMAAESSLDRAFVRTGPNRLAFRSERSLPTPGNGPVRKHVFYRLNCRRIVDDSPH